MRAWPLTGGVSAEVTVLEVEHADGAMRRLIVRRHGAVDLAQNPRVARDEHELLRLVRAHGIAAPRPWHSDESGTLLPTPFVVLDYVEGATDFEPDDLPDYLRQLAVQLARIHRIADPDELAFLLRREPDLPARPATLDLELSEDRIRAALEPRWPPPRVNRPVLLHGDYWPGNLLWRDGQLVAVLDWEDARVGDPLADLGNTRLEVLWWFGADALRSFTDHYRAHATLDWSALPHWDLAAALRPCGRLAGWGLDAATAARLRARHAAFVSQAISALPR